MGNNSQYGGINALPSVVDTAMRAVVGVDTASSYLSAFEAAHSVFREFGLLMDAPSPYSKAAAVDPEAKLLELFQKLREHNRRLMLMECNNNPSNTNWETYADAAWTEANKLISTDYIDDMVTAYDADGIGEYADAVNDVSGALFQSNASEGSALVMALALLRARRMRNNAKFRADLLGDAQKQRVAMTMQGTSEMKQGELAVADAYKTHIALGIQLETMWVSQMRERQADNINYAVEDATWNISLYPHITGVIGAPGGGTFLPKQPSKLSTIAAGVLSGAATGLSVGMAGGPMGAGIGAGVGGLLGALGGIL